MKFPKISAVVPQGEHFDESAVNEGVWLSENHLNAVENALSVAETATAAAASSLETANTSVRNLTEELAAEKSNSAKLTAEKEAAEKKAADLETEHATAIGTKDAKIVTLQAEVAKLGKTPSGTGSTLPVTKDEHPEETSGKPGLLDPNHPVNLAVAAKLARTKKSKS